MAVRGPARVNPPDLHEVKADRIRQGETLIAEAPEQRGGGLHVGGPGLDDRNRLEAGTYPPSPDRSPAAPTSKSYTMAPLSD